MKESNTLAGSVTIKQLQRAILLNMKEQYMKKSNFLAGNAIIEHLQKNVMLDTKGQYMKLFSSQFVYNLAIVLNNINPMKVRNKNLKAIILHLFP